MSHMLLPETIRGCWYYLSGAVTPNAMQAAKFPLYAFRMDNTFSRYQFKDGVRKLVESGEYTFDGNFLILRGRNTDTFRVQPRAFWRWELEGKKTGSAMVRGLVQEQDFSTLSSEQARELRILPLRATVHSPLLDDRDDYIDAIYELHYTPAGGDPIRIGSFFVERPDAGQLWVGLTPYVTGLELQTWERIIRDSFLDIFLGKPKDAIGVVTVRLLDSHTSQVFNYHLG